MSQPNSIELQSLIDEIASILNQPAIADIQFWQNILTPENLTQLKQAINNKETELISQQVDYTGKISQLLTNEDPGLWQQGIELLHSLDNEKIWDSITKGCQLTDNGLFESQHLKATHGVFTAWCENPYIQHDEGTFNFSKYATDTLYSHLIEGYKWKNPDTVLEQVLSPLVHFKKLRLQIRIEKNGIHNVDFLKKLPNIIELTTSQQRHARLDYSFLASLINLEHLTMRGNVHIETLEPLSGLTTLRSITINLPADDSFCENSSITDLSALSALTKLETIDVQKLEALTSLNGLQNASAIHKVSLSHLPSITTLNGINTTSLTTLNITRCETLHDISGLLGAACLTDITITGTSRRKGNAPIATQISSLDGLADCPKLRRLHFSKAGSHLTNIDGLRGCPTLQEFTLIPVHYTHLALTDINALSHCTELVSLHIPYGRNIKHFPDLRKCSKLETIELNKSQIPNLNGLQGCLTLKTVRFLYSRELTSIKGLMASPNLEEIHIPSSNKLQEIGDLRALPKLHKFNLSTNNNTSSFSHPQPCASNTLHPCPPKNDGMLTTRADVESYQDKIRLMTAIQKNERTIVESFVHTKHLDLHGFQSFTKPGLLQRLTNLEYLNLKDCTGLPYKSWQKEYTTAEKVSKLLQKLAKRFPL